MDNIRLFRRLKKIQRNIKNKNPNQDMEEKELVEKLILGIIHDLDWKGVNIYEQYTIRNGGIPDIILLNNNYTKAIVEAKRADQNLEEHKEQLYNYVMNTGSKLGVLTNGHNWWFFLPRYRDKWRFKKFNEIDIEKLPPEVLHERFMTFLSREKVISSQYSRIARKCIGEFYLDDSIAGISDNELMKRIDELGPFKKLSFEDKVLCNELKYESFMRGLLPKYCL